MSTGTTPLPSPDQAYNTLFNEVHANVFFNKLASAGIHPKTQADAAELLKLAGNLRLVANDPTIKAASDNSSPYAAVNSSLEAYLAQHGLDGRLKQASQQEADLAINQTVASLMTNPAIYNAALSLKSAEAQELAQQLGIGQGDGQPAPQPAN